MSKFLPLLLLIFILSACNKSKPTSTPTVLVLHTIPNWATDTLVATTPYTPYLDTIFSYTNSGHSFIIYHGTTYALWDQRTETMPWVNNDQVYLTAVIGAYMSDSTSILPVKVSPASYQDNNGVWKTQLQSITVPAQPPFNASAINGLYQHQS
jgi:hypothetical protein